MIKRSQHKCTEKKIESNQNGVKKDEGRHQYDMKSRSSKKASRAAE